MNVVEEHFQQVDILKKGWKFTATHGNDIAKELTAQIESTLPPTKECKDDNELEKKSNKEERDAQQEIRARLKKD